MITASSENKHQRLQPKLITAPVITASVITAPVITAPSETDLSDYSPRDNNSLSTSDYSPEITAPSNYSPL